MNRFPALAVSAFAALAATDALARGASQDGPAAEAKAAAAKEPEKERLAVEKVEVQAVLPAPVAVFDAGDLVVGFEVNVVEAPPPRFDLKGMFRAVVRAVVPDAFGPDLEPPPPVVMGLPALALPAEAAVADPAQPRDDDPMVQQWAAQYRPLLRSEYAFLKAVCRPDKLQRERIALAGERALREAARETVRSQNTPGPAGPGPRKRIREGLTKAVKEQLPGDAVRQFLEAVDERDAGQRHAVVVNLVVMLERELVLSFEQRGRIQESLSKGWDDSWCQSLEAMIAYGDQYFPAIPDDQLAPYLTAEQKKLWASAQKVQYDAGFTNGEDSGFENPELDEAMQAEAARIEKDLAKRPGVGL